MFKTHRETLAYVRELVARAGDLEGVEVVVAPPLTALATAVEAAHGTVVGIAAQNAHFEKQGAFTGEVSAAMVKDAGAGYVILGHSERRRMFGDTDEWVNRKVVAAFEAGLVPIFCIGETLDERDSGQMPAVLDRQLQVGLSGVSAAHVAALIIAYEPVWAIGTGKNATPVEADEAHRHIRARLAGMYDQTTADACRILYGGSVKPDNIAALAALPDVDGALIGGASLEADSFLAIISGARAGRTVEGQRQR
jgi:triosephosphate isomerase